MEKVYVTGAHQNIVVTEKGVETVKDAKANAVMVESILNPMKTTVERQMAELDEKSLEKPLSATEKRRHAELGEKHQAITSLTDSFQGGRGTYGEAPGGGLPASLPSLPSGSPPGGRIVGGFTELKGEYEKALRGHNLPSGTSPAARSARFKTAIRIFPFRGGIILGNATHPDSGKVQKVHFDLTGGNPVIEMSVEQGGKLQECRFDGMTAQELWSAYNFVKPSSSFRQQFGIDENENGLVGKSGDLDDDSGWEFGVHPAVAGTLVARDAMRLDMLIAASDGRISAVKTPDFDTYQWYDEVAKFRVEDGVIKITAESEPRDILLRVRLWTNGLPSWAKSRSSLEADVLQESQRRLLKEIGKGGPRSGFTELKALQLSEKIVQQLAEEMEAAGGGNVPFQSATAIKKLSGEFDAFRRIERFAKAVAVLHWIADTCSTGLPPLPEQIQPKRFDIPAQIKESEVHAIRVTR